MQLPLILLLEFFPIWEKIDPQHKKSDHKEGWAPKNWCFWIVLLEKTLQSPLDSKEIKPVNPKGNQPWIFIGRTDAEAEAPILWPSDVKSWLIRKAPDTGKDWRQEEKGMTEDEMVVWNHWLNGHEFEQTPGDSEGREAWRATVHGVTKSWTQLSDWTEWLIIKTMVFPVVMHRCDSWTVKKADCWRIDIFKL